jgi:hypothetical protein
LTDGVSADPFLSTVSRRRRRRRRLYFSLSLSLKFRLDDEFGGDIKDSAVGSHPISPICPESRRRRRRDEGHARSLFLRTS